jgi:hypothetical protein
VCHTENGKYKNENGKWTEKGDGERGQKEKE